MLIESVLMSIEIVCPHCKTHILAEAGEAECYACHRMIVVEPKVGPAPADRTECAEAVVAFLREMAFDGKLSADEIWALANFLNNQPDEVLEQWPANLLFPLLQNVFVDWHLSAEELQAVAGAVGKIKQELDRRSSR